MSVSFTKVYSGKFTIGIRKNVLTTKACDVGAALNEKLEKSPTVTRATKDSLSIFREKTSPEFWMRATLRKEKKSAVLHPRWNIMKLLSQAMLMKIEASGRLEKYPND